MITNLARSIWKAYLLCGFFCEFSNFQSVQMSYCNLGDHIWMVFHQSAPAYDSQACIWL